MSDKFVTFDEGRSTPTGLPQAVDTKITARYATKAELQSAVIGTGGVVSSSVSRIITSTDPNTPLQEGDLLLIFEPPFSLVEDFADGLEGWSSRWGGGLASWSANTDSGSLDGHAVQQQGAVVGRYALGWDAVDEHTPADVELLARVKGTSLSVSTSGLVVRGAGGDGTQTGYRAMMANGSAALSKFVDGTSTILAQTNPIGPAEGWFWIRFRVQGSTIQAKFWADGTQEPTTWTRTVTDTTIPDGGFVGISSGGGAQAAMWDYVSVAVDGETAVAP